jgi:hypothetical protein
MRRENISKVGDETVSQLLRGGGVRTVRIDEVGDSVLPISLDNSMVKEGSVSITCERPILFGPLDVVLFFFAHEILVFIMKVLLQIVVLLGWGQTLLNKNLILNLSNQVIIVGFFLPPFPEICSKKFCFLREITCRRAMPTLPGYVMVIIIH